MRFVWGSLGLFVFVAATALPCYTAGPDVDQGWSQILTQCTDLRYGVDFIFPYGPLHGLVTCAWHPDQFWWKYGLELLGKVAMTLLLVRLAVRMPPIIGSLWLAGFGWLMLILPMHAEFALLAGVAALVVPLLKNRIPVPDIFLASTYLAAISLSKFTACPFALAGLFILSVRCDSWRKLLPFAIYFTALAGFFAISGQRVGDLPAFLASGLSYSSAYGAMALGGPFREVQLALVMLSLLAFALLPLRRATWPIGAILALACGVAWKSGFTRHDSHALGFFGMMLFLPAVASRVSHRRGVLALVTVLAGVGFMEVLIRCQLVSAILSTSVVDRWPQKATQLLHPGAVRLQQESLRHSLAAEHDLPAIRAVVGQEPMDVFTDCQGVALLNGLNLQPRPTLQSVNAVKPEWLERNAAILCGDSAPKFLLVNWVSFDLRYPTLTEGPALLAMLEHYDVKLEERGYLLLERRPKPRPIAKEMILDQRLNVNDVLELPPLKAGELRTLTLDFHFTDLGALRAAAYRPPVLFFLVRDEAGEWHNYRLVAPMARCEFLLDPLCENTKHLQQLFESASGRRITALRIHVMKSEVKFVKESFTVTVKNLRISK